MATFVPHRLALALRTASVSESDLKHPGRARLESAGSDSLTLAVRNDALSFRRRGFSPLARLSDRTDPLGGPVRRVRYHVKIEKRALPGDPLKPSTAVMP